MSFGGCFSAIEYLLLQPRSAPKDASDQLMLKELRPKRQEKIVFFCIFAILCFFNKNAKRQEIEKYYPNMTDREKLPCDPLHAKQATSCVLFSFHFSLCFVALAAHSEGLYIIIKPFLFCFSLCFGFSLFLFLVGFGVIRFGRYTLQQVSCYTTPERIPTFMATALLSLAGNILFGI